MRRVALAAGLVLALAACSEWQTGGNIGGANQNGRGPGNRQGGLALANGEVAVHAHGHFFVTVKDGTLVVGELGGANVRALDGIGTPRRIAFWEGSAGDGLVVLASGSSGERLLSWSRAADQVLWQRELARSDRWLDINSTGTRLALTGDTILIVDAATGADVGTLAPRSPVRDVDFSADGKRLLVTEETVWKSTDGTPHTDVTVNDADTGEESCRVDTQNCADELVLSPDGERAFLAPTLCAKDPVSVVKVSSAGCALERQLPGFGSVALSPDGRTAVAFLDRDNAEAATLGMPAEVVRSSKRFHLMFIDVASLEYRTAPVSNQLPRYAFTPDGAKMLVDTPMDLLSNVVLLDVASGRSRVLRGPPAKLHRYSLLPDSGRVFTVDNGLFELDLGDAVVRPVPTSFPPAVLNITPDGRTLLAGDGQLPLLHLLDTGSRRESRRISY